MRARARLAARARASGVSWALMASTIHRTAAVNCSSLGRPIPPEHHAGVTARRALSPHGGQQRPPTGRRRADRCIRRLRYEQPHDEQATRAAAHRRRRTRTTQAGKSRPDPRTAPDVRPRARPPRVPYRLPSQRGLLTVEASSSLQAGLATRHPSHAGRRSRAESGGNKVRLADRTGGGGSSGGG